MKTNAQFKKVPLSQVIAEALETVTELPWFEGFHAGTHTAMNGAVHTYTQADLQQMVDNFVPGTVPFLTRHPEANEPSYGYANEVKLTDDGQLYLNGDNVNVDFAKSVMAGNFGKRSLGLSKDKKKGWFIDHVAFLGAQKPSLDLKPVGEYTFSQAKPDSIEYEFSIETQTANTLVRLINNLRDFFLSNEDEETADKIIDKWDLEWLTKSVAREEIKDEAKHEHLYNKPEEPNVNQFTKAQLDAAIKSAVDEATVGFTAKFDAAEQRATAAEAKLQAAEKDKEKAAFTAKVAACQTLVDAKVKDGILTPAEASGLADFMANLSSDEDSKFEFSRGEGDAKETVKKSPYEFGRALIDGLGKVKSPIGGDDQEPVNIGNDDLDKKVTAYAKEHSVSYGDALSIVSAE